MGTIDQDAKEIMPDKELLEKIAKANQKSLEMEENAIREFIRLGKLLNKLKLNFEEENKGNKVNEKWGTYLNKHLPYLHIKRAERAMRLARSINLKKLPALACISQRKLSRIVSLSKQSVADTLKEEGIDSNIQLDNQEEVTAFQEKMTKLIKRHERKEPLKLLERTLDTLKNKIDEIINDKPTNKQFNNANLEEIEQALTDILERFRKMRNGTC